MVGDRGAAVVREEPDQETTEFLLSRVGRQALTRLRDQDLGHAHTLPLVQGLRLSFSLEQASALLNLARLRQKAERKFPFAAELYLTAESLEQATALPVARHRAAWIHAHAPPGPVLDLGCGIGGDTIALAERRPVIAYDHAPARLAFAQANAQMLGLADRIDFRLADWTVLVDQDALPNAAAAFVDPARRVAGRRVFSLYRMQPALPALLSLQSQIPALGAKVAPGVHDGEIPDSCCVQFISHEKICKEAVLWFGPLADPCCRRWASVHDGTAWHTLQSSLAPVPLGDLEPGHYLHEPDPAVIRAGAFAELAQLLQAHLIDRQIAYLVGPIPSRGSQAAPYVQTFQIVEILPSSLKRLNRYLQAARVGQVEIKKRGVPIEPESLRPRLALTPGGDSAVVILTRRGDQRTTIVGHRV